MDHVPPCLTGCLHRPGIATTVPLSNLLASPQVDRKSLTGKKASRQDSSLLVLQVLPGGEVEEEGR